MRAKQLVEVLTNLDQSKRIKFQNAEGWKDQTVAINAILEQGDVYILIWACHPHCIKEDLKEGQKLVWYNPDTHNSELVKDYFPDYNTTSLPIFTADQIRDRLLKISPQIKKESEYTNPFIYEDVKKWYNELG